jgi:hypothetical protein
MVFEVAFLLPETAFFQFTHFITIGVGHGFNRT